MIKVAYLLQIQKKSFLQIKISGLSFGEKIPAFGGDFCFLIFDDFCCRGLDGSGRDIDMAAGAGCRCRRARDVVASAGGQHQDGGEGDKCFHLKISFENSLRYKCRRGNSGSL